MTAEAHPNDASAVSLWRCAKVHWISESASQPDPGAGSRAQAKAEGKLHCPYPCLTKLTGPVEFVRAAK
jgi:hypothetical protein